MRHERILFWLSRLSSIISLSVVGDGIEQRGLPGFDSRDGALERGSDLAAVLYRSFGVPAHGSCQAREIRRWIRQVHADVRALERIARFRAMRS
jgi:hypothetical protein